MIIKTLYADDYKTFEALMSAFKKKTKTSKLIKILRDKKFYQKPSDKKREAKNKANKKYKKRLEKTKGGDE